MRFRENPTARNDHMLELWPDKFPKMATVLPDGASFGRAKVVHRTVSKRDAERVTFSMLRSGRGNMHEGDTYATLYVGGHLWMSDTHDERRDHLGVLWNASKGGEVLIGGLGLGMVALGCLLDPKVARVTVLEKDPDVISLVDYNLWIAMLEAGIPTDKLQVIQADVFTWKPPKGEKFDVIWMDVWGDLEVRDLVAHEKCNRRYARWKNKDGWMGCWGHEFLLRQREQEKEHRRRWYG